MRYAFKSSPWQAAAAALLGAAVSFGGAQSALAEPTEVVVRVLSKDAKFVGTSMGGVRVTLRDAHTGEILATGLTAGGTGDTKRIMHTGGGRRMELSDKSAAKFVAALDLKEPRMVEVEAFGPLGQAQAAHRVVSTQWVVPGRHVAGGDGWVLELPGFVVDVLAPPAHIKLAKGVSNLDLRANVMMMCGCPIEPKGLWEAGRYEVKAILRRNGEPAGTYELSYAGETSQFAGSVPVAGPGAYEVIVYAYDPVNGNTGLDRTTFIVE
jgi:hypothetical protein